MFDKIVERLTADHTPPNPLISAKRTEEEEQHRKRGLKLSIILHLFLLIILVFPFISALPPMGQEGIIINFGHTDTGQGNEQPLVEDATSDASSEPSPSEPIADASTASNSNPTPPTPKPRETPKPVAKKEVVTDANADTPSVKKDDKKAKEDAAKKAKAEEEKRKKDEAKRKEEEKKKVEAEAKRKAEEEAKRKAEEIARKKEEAKKKFGFPGQNSSTSQGENGETGNQGSSDGDPNAENLDTRQSGKGKAGEGIDLAGRSVVTRPTVDENSNEAGTVRVRICVDNEGRVTTAKSTAQGSTITNTDIIELAESKAKEFQFSKNNARREQCGSILFTFTVE